MRSGNPLGAGLNAREMRVIVLPPTRADGLAMKKLFEMSGIECEIVSNIAQLCAAIEEGGASVILSEESLVADPSGVIECVGRQEVWSDLPIVVLSKSGSEAVALTQVLHRLGNVSVVERPVRTSTLVSLVRSNHRARARQYQLREYLAEREQLLRSEQAARSQSERASRMKDEFLATLSHELRTPLNAVLGWTKVLQSSRDLPMEATKALDVIERNARSQAQIIEDLLDMSSIISGKVRLDVQKVDLNSIIATTVETVRPAAEARDIRFGAVLDPLAGPVRGDPNRLQQILWNLLTNAVKFTQRGGRVTITVARINSHLEIEVADTGEGIDPAFLPHVFDRFRQADATSARQHGGLGLGLSIVKQLVELHGGTITAKSPGKGLGSTFRIGLPLMPMNADPSESEDARQHPRRSAGISADLRPVDLNGIAVLVVDDELDSRMLIERLLVGGGARVVTAASAAAAMQALLRETPDVLVSDIGMPGDDGYTLIRRVRNSGAEFAHIPAIALTAYARIEDRVRAIQAGYQIHLSKPVEPIEFLAMVNSIGQRPRES
jgi:signal transduction histidine kinase/CheY-like chemotaxis protein